MRFEYQSPESHVYIVELTNFLVNVTASIYITNGVDGKCKRVQGMFKLGTKYCCAQKLNCTRAN